MTAALAAGISRRNARRSGEAAASTAEAASRLSTAAASAEVASTQSPAAAASQAARDGRRKEKRDGGEVDIDVDGRDSME